MKFLLFFAGIAFFQFSFCQENFELLINSGHAKRFEDVDISYDDKIMAILGQDDIITIWDTQKNIQLQRIVNSKIFEAQHIELTPDGKFLFLYSYKRKVLEKYDIKSEKVVDTRKLEYSSFSQPENHHLSISPDGDKLIFLDKNKLQMVSAKDLSKTIGSVDNVFSGIELRFSDLGNYIYYRNYKGVQLYDPSTLELKKDWIYPDSIRSIYMNSIYISPNASEIIFINKEFDIISYNLLKESSNVLKIGRVNEVHFSRDYAYLYFLTSNSNGSKIYALNNVTKSYDYELNIGKLGNYKILRVSPDNNRIYVVANHQGRSVNVFDIKTGTLLHSFSGDLYTADQLSLSHDGDQLFLSGSFDNKTWNLNNGLIKSNLNQFEKNKTSGSITESKSGAYKVFVNQGTKYMIFGRGDLKVLDSNNVVIRSINKKEAQTEALLFDDKEKYLWSVESQLKVKYLIRYALDTSLQDLTIEIGDNGSNDLTPILLTKNGKQIIVDTFNGFSIYDTETGDLIKSTDEEGNLSFGVEGMMLTNDGGLYLRASSSEIECYDTQNWKLRYHRDEFTLGMSYASKWGGTDYFAFYLENGDIRLMEPKAGNYVKTIESEGSKIIHSVYDSIHDNFYTLSKDGEIKLWDTKTYEIRVKMIPTRKDGFFIIDNNNMYMASKDALRLVHFKNGNEILTFESLDITNNQPHRILKTIGVASDEEIKLYENAFDKRLKERGFNEVPQNILDNIPQLTVASEVPVSTNDSILDFNIKAESKGADIIKIHCYLNGARLTGREGLLIENPSLKVDESFTLQLGPGLNHIQLGVENENGQISSLENMYVVSTYEFNQKQTYLVAIGISDYENDKYNLEYPSKDVRDVVAYFENKYKDSTLKILQLTNEDATFEKLEDIIEFVSKTKTQDELIVFVAGHGVLDENFDYYFAPHDFDFNNPSKQGWMYSQLEEVFDYAPARKRLLLIDACHSGAVDKESVFISDEVATIEGIKFRGAGNSVGVQQNSALETFKVMRTSFADLRSLTGTFVLSSAGGTEYAFESQEWNNGVFTYSVLEGLSKKKADLDKNTKIDVLELSKYVELRVSELTKGKQLPNLREVNLLGTFEFR